jgi:nicotinic acid phosphoribosyltransferase
MIFQSPLQLYAEPNVYNLLKDIQLQWRSRGEEDETSGVYTASADGTIQGVQTLLEWLSAPMIYSDVAMRKLMSLRDNTGVNVFSESFLNFLQRFRFSGDLWAMAEGTITFAGQPILQMKGKAIEVAVIKLWIAYLLHPKAGFQEDTNFLQIRRFYNSDAQMIQDVIYSLENQPIVNFEAATWKDLLQAILSSGKIVNRHS